MAKVAAALFLGSLAAVVAGLLVHPPPGMARWLFGVVVLALWTTLVVVYPLAALRTGANFGYGGGWVLRREREPVFFWLWLAIWSLLLVVLWLLGAAFVLHL